MSENARGIHEERTVTVPAPPRGSRFKGYTSFVVQDLVIRRHVVNFRCERWQTLDGDMVTAPLPAGIDGHFGPELRRFVLAQYHQGQMTVPRLVTLLRGLSAACAGCAAFPLGSIRVAGSASGVRSHDGVGHREGRAEDLRDHRAMFPCGIGDFHVAVHPDAQFTAQDRREKGLRVEPWKLLKEDRPEPCKCGVTNFWNYVLAKHAVIGAREFMGLATPAAAGACGGITHGACATMGSIA